MAEYAENKFENCFDQLYARYKTVRRLRRDGNCFYRAFLFQLFEYFAKTKNEQYTAFLKCIEDSKQDLMTNGGYEEIVIEDFYETFLEAV